MIQDGIHATEIGSFYFVGGRLHREDGPAIHYVNGTKFWYLNGKWINVYSQKEFEQYLRLLAFI
jgi:hypothetical protein